METLNCCPQWLDKLADVTAIIAGLFALVGGGIAIWQYKSNNKTRRSQFYFEVFKLGFVDNTLDEIRNKLDQWVEGNIAQKQYLLDGIGEPNLVKYFNYFEFVLSLNKLKITNNEDVNSILESHLSKIKIEINPAA